MNYVQYFMWGPLANSLVMPPFWAPLTMTPSKIIYFQNRRDSFLKYMVSELFLEISLEASTPLTNL